MTTKNNITEEPGSSFGVDAHSASPVGGTVTPPGGDAGGEKDIVRISPTAVNPKSKAGMISAIVSKLGSMNKGDVKSVYKSVAGVPAGEQDRPKQGNSIISQPKRVTREDINVADDIEAVFEGTELTEEFKTKATEIFETAVITAINTKLEEIAEGIDEQVEEEVASIEEALEAKLNDYLDYVVESWMDENRLAVEPGLRNEIAESFLAGIRQLFETHYIDVPEEKTDMVAELTQKIDELSEKLNEQIEENIELNTIVTSLARNEVFAECVEGLTDIQIDKLAKLAESVEFTDSEDFTTKIKTLRENYFPSDSTKSARALTESVAADLTDAPIAEDTKTEEKIVPAEMKGYIDALDRSFR